MAEVWFTADLHIGHDKVTEYRAEVMEIGPGWHDDILAAVWDQRIAPDDHIWVLGDISSGSGSGQKRALAWLKQRPGVKHLIAGNHDGIHPLHRDSHKWFPVYLEVFSSVQLAARRRVPLENGHVTALLSHFPYVGDHTVEDRYIQWRLRDCGEWLIHGHTHSTSAFSGHPRAVHVGVDAWEFSPVHWDEIVSLIRSRVCLTDE